MPIDIQSLPHSQESEEAVLCAMIIDNKKIGQLSLLVKSEYFYFDRNKIIFQSILHLFNNGFPIDIITINDQLSSIGKIEFIGGISVIANIISSLAISSNATHHAKIVKEKYKLRELATKCLESYDSVMRLGVNNFSTIASNLTKEIFHQLKDNSAEKTETIDTLEDFSKMQEEYLQNQIDGKTCIGIPSGYKSFDRIIDGYRPEHFITIAAEPSVGKSSVAINMTYKLLEQDKRVVIFSLEMSKNDMISKLLGIRTKTAPIQMMKAYTDNSLYDKQVHAKHWLKGRKLTMYSDLDDIDEICMAMQVEEMKEHVDLFILDYIQNISSTKYRDEYSLLTNGVKQFQKVNRNLGTTFLCLSQISNDARKSASTLSVDGKGTGAIRAASNVFIYLKRDVEKEEQINEIIKNGEDMPLLCVINKNRHGSIGAFKIKMVLKSGEIFEPY